MSGSADSEYMYEEVVPMDSHGRKLLWRQIVSSILCL
jgi:hypothetical protein